MVASVGKKDGQRLLGPGAVQRGAAAYLAGCGGCVLRILDVTRRLSFRWMEDANGNSQN